MRRRAIARSSFFTLALTLGALSSLACTSSSGGGTGGGAVSGPADMHCKGVTPQPTNQGDCHVVSDGGTGGSGGSDYGATMDGNEGDDDDCKYHVSWTSTPIAENQDVSFTLTGTYLANGQPDPPACANCSVSGLNTNNFYAEVYLNDTHPAPPTNEVVAAGATGTYTIGPIQFDAPGKWTVRFHLFELCTDVTDDSPHGHAAFYVDVP